MLGALKFSEYSENLRIFGGHRRSGKVPRPNAGSSRPTPRVRIFVRPLCPSDEIFGGDHRFIETAITYAINRQFPVVVKELDPVPGCTFRK